MKNDKDALKKCWKECLSVAQGGGFVDGLVLGTLINFQPDDMPEWLTVFDEWKQSILEMEFKEDPKKLLIYSAYLVTYFKGKEMESRANQNQIKKRELKGILKQRESIDSTSGAEKEFLSDSLKLESESNPNSSEVEPVIKNDNKEEEKKN